MEIDLGRGVIIGTYDSPALRDDWRRYAEVHGRDFFVVRCKAGLSQNTQNSSDFLIREVAQAATGSMAHLSRWLVGWRECYAIDPLLNWDTEKHCWMEKDHVQG